MINQITEAVRKSWYLLGMDDPVPDKMNYIMQSRRRVIFFLFDPNQANRLVIVVKFDRHPEKNNQMKEYVDRIQRVRVLLDASTQATIPRMYLLEPINGLVSVAQQALPGRPIEVAAISYGRSAVGICRAFADWLVCFQANTQSDLVKISRDSLEQMVYSPLKDLPGVTDKTRSLVEDITSSLIGLQIALVWACGDTHLSNILMKDGKISGFIDWEAITPDQWPVFDWFQFVLSLVREVLKAQHPSADPTQHIITACEIMMKPADTPLSEVLHQQTAYYFSKANLDSEYVLPLFLTFLIDYYWFEGREVLIPQILARLGPGATVEKRIPILAQDESSFA